MPTEVKKAIRSSAAWTANQTAMEALYGAGNYYTTLTAWEAAEQGDLVSADQIRTAVCYNDWPSGLVDTCLVDGWTTDATRYAQITVAPGNGHSGVPTDGFFLAKTGDYAKGVENRTPYTRITGIRIAMSAGTVQWAVDILSGTATNTYLSEVLTTHDSTGFQNFGVVVRLVKVYVRNCLFIGGYCGVWIDEYVPDALIDNCVMKGCTRGISTAYSYGTAIVKNCVTYSCASDLYGPGVSSSSSNNATTQSSGLPGASNVYNITPSDFVDASAGNFHLTSGSLLRGVGANRYSEFGVDVDGDARPSSGAWDIGYDRYVVVSTLPTLTLPTATSITSTTATARVTVTY